MVLEGATLYYKKMHSIDDQVCMNTYDGSRGSAMIVLYFMVQLLKDYFHFVALFFLHNYQSRGLELCIYISGCLATSSYYTFVEKQL